MRVGGSVSLSSPLSLRELVSSGVLEKTQFVLPDDNGNIISRFPPAEPTAAADNRRLFQLNAVELFILLTRTVSGLAGGPGTSTGTIESTTNLDCRNITIEFKAEFDDDEYQHESSQPRSIILLGAAVARSPGSQRRRSDDLFSSLSPLQSLATVFWSVHDLSNGNQLLQSILSLRQISDDDLSSGSTSDYGSRSSKLSRRSSNSSNGGDSGAFEQLRQIKRCPTSMARLISDLLDERCDSIDEVKRELADMASTPELFLFDPDADFSTKNLSFGGKERHYGQASEVKRVLQIANRAISIQDPTREAEISYEAVRGCACQVDSIFISGVAGSGKSSLATYVSSFLSSELNWLTASAKFKINAGHESGRLVFDLFDKLVKDILVANQKESGESNVAYSSVVSSAILDTFDVSNLTSLRGMLPGLNELLSNLDTCYAPLPVSNENEMSRFRMTFLLSKLLAVILSTGRDVFLVLDDLQWCESSTLELVSEILISVSHQKIDGNRHLIYAGIYRDDEADASQQVSSHIETLRRSQSVDVAEEFALTSLTRDDIAEVLMAEMRLPYRLVSKLAGVVYHRTLGHAMFVIQLLNGLASSSIISYSPVNNRFVWDTDKLANVKTFDSVASLIISNLTSINEQSQKVLRVLACLLGQADLSILRLLESNESIAPEYGFEIYLQGLVENGIVEVTDTFVSFTHDLILQQVYDTMTHEERSQLHFDVGTHLGNVLGLNDEERTLESIMKSLDIQSDTISDASCHDDADLAQLLGLTIFVAVDQVNLAGSGMIVGNANRLRFAKWNKVAADEAVKLFSYQISANLYMKAIDLLPDQNTWITDNRELCQMLYEGAADSLFALGKLPESVDFASAVIKNTPFEESMRAYYLLVRSLNGLSQFSGTIATGVAVFRTIGIDIPNEATPQTIFNMMQKTGERLNEYDTEQILDMVKTTACTRTQGYDLLFHQQIRHAAFRQTSPYLPIFSCIFIQYALENRVCGDLTDSLVTYGMLLTILGENFAEARKVAELCQQLKSSRFSRMILNAFLNLWFAPHYEIAQVQLDIYTDSMKAGDMDIAAYAIGLHYRFSLFSGSQKLSAVAKGMRSAIQEFSKFNVALLSFGVLDILLIDSLTGDDSKPFSACDRPEFQNEDSLIAHAKACPQSVVFLYVSYFMKAFWSGDYKKANKYYGMAEVLPSFQVPPKVHVFNAMFYHGLISFQSFRGGEGEECFERGKATLEKVKRWEPNCKHTFHSKLLLLEAEYYASMCDITSSKESYEKAAKVAREHGLVHEQGLAYELYGAFLKSIVEIEDAIKYFTKACDCYTIWGAHAKVSQLRKEHELTFDHEAGMRTESAFGSKRGRADLVTGG